mmetsp:Transcript_1489/g.4835  ORF Transcript_1489/g.4835 Transcript_1489/m.4835 type:complete len:200 (-) Transcript_1489:5087-5686(-)
MAGRICTGKPDDAAVYCVRVLDEQSDRRGGAGWSGFGSCLDARVCEGRASREAPDVLAHHGRPHLLHGRDRVVRIFRPAGGEKHVRCVVRDDGYRFQCDDGDHRHLWDLHRRLRAGLDGEQHTERHEAWSGGHVGRCRNDPRGVLVHDIISVVLRRVLRRPISAFLRAGSLQRHDPLVGAARPAGDCNVSCCGRPAHRR